MSLTVVLILVVTFSVVVNGLLRRYTSQPSLLSGVEYLLIGLVLGPYAADLLSQDVTDRLQPVISLVMGLVGFILGLPLRHRVQHLATMKAGLLTSLLVAAGVGGATYVVLRWVIATDTSPIDVLWLSLAIGAAGTTMAGPLLEAGVTRIGASGPVTELIRSHGVMGNIVGVVTAGVALALARSHSAAHSMDLTETEWLVASAGFGLGCGVLFSLFLGRQEETADRTFLATVGVVIFTSGVAFGMGVSPLLLNAIAGLVTSFLYRHADRLHEVLQALHGPACTILLIFAGAMWIPPPALGWLLPLTYLVTRFLAVRGAAALSLRAVHDVPQTPRVGNGLIGQGALAAAIVMNFSQVNPELASLALTAVLPTLLISAPLSPHGLRATLADAGEIGRITADDDTEREGEGELA